MKYEDLCEAIKEAERFLKRAKVAKSKFQMRGTNAPYYFSDDGKANGFCLRASMDLTRALADLRHPWRKKETG